MKENEQNKANTTVVNKHIVFRHCGYLITFTNFQRFS